MGIIPKFGTMQKYVDDLIRRALAEDTGDGDHSSQCVIPTQATGQMQLLIKEAGILAGIWVAERVAAQVDRGLDVEVYKSDGEAVKPGDIALKLSGRVHSLLKAERLLLNFAQRLSGIATTTHKLSRAIAHTPAKLLDTRKTTPTLRPLEKRAVALGGGVNHRMGLYDMIMLKDNHIDFAGGIKPAVENARKYLAAKGLDLPIEVETRNLAELEQVLACPGVSRVMLDNFSVTDCKRGVKRAKGQLATEASGGIDQHNLVAYAETGVDYISMGALTHSVKSLDMSLKAQL